MDSHLLESPLSWKDVATTLHHLLRSLLWNGAAKRRYPLVDAFDDPPTPTPHISNTQEYFAHRSELHEREASLGFQWACQNAATEEEKRANDILQVLKDRDADRIFKNAAPSEGYRGQLHPRFPGDHVLSNIGLLETTDVFRAVSKMPKSAHLHIHFNNNLPPEFLLNIAAGMKQMFIKSDRPLLERVDLDSCKVEFLIRSETEEGKDGREWGSLLRKLRVRPMDEVYEVPRNLPCPVS